MRAWALFDLISGNKGRFKRTLTEKLSLPSGHLRAQNILPAHTENCHFTFKLLVLKNSAYTDYTYGVAIQRGSCFCHLFSAHYAKVKTVDANVHNSIVVLLESCRPAISTIETVDSLSELSIEITQMFKG